MTQQGKKATWRSLIALEAATLGAGALVGYLTRDGMDFFHALNKPGFAPPGWLFPIVWSILYARWRTACGSSCARRGATVSCCWGCISPS